MSHFIQLILCRVRKWFCVALKECLENRSDSEMDLVENTPQTLMGWPIKTRMQIWFNWIIPVVLEQFVYIVLITADVAVTYQHFIEGNHLYAALTLSFIWLPALLTFCSIIISPQSWPNFKIISENEDENSRCRLCITFVGIIIVNGVLFPIGAMARY